MVDTDRILPVLDGLDEMDPPDAQPVLARATLDRLNKPPWRNRAVVITCRSSVYDAIRGLCDDAGLQFATTVTLQPLSAEDIYIYLEQYRDEHRQAEAKWAPVTDQLERTPDGILATALGTPWLLSLAAMVLKRGGHETATKLAACRDTAQIRELLFATLIPAAVDGTPDTEHTRDYTEENVAGCVAHTGRPSRTAAHRTLRRQPGCTRPNLAVSGNTQMPRAPRRPGRFDMAGGWPRCNAFARGPDARQHQGRPQVRPHNWYPSRYPDRALSTCRSGRRGRLI